MGKVKRTLCFLVVFTMSFQTTSLWSLTPEGESPESFDDSAPPIRQNPEGTTEGVTCSMGGERPVTGPGGVCCVGFMLNAAGICDEPPMQDSSLVSCTTNNDCSGGMGCFPQNATDLFSNLVPSTVDPDVRQERQFELELELEGTGPVGSVCAHARECISYSCEEGRCSDKKACRFANENELAAGGINCGPGLEKNAQGVCQKSAAAANRVFLGLLNGPIITQTGECQFELDEKFRTSAMNSMRSLRAMEWFFSKITAVHNQDECLEIIPTLKTEIGEKFTTPRKNLLANFSSVFAQIEGDFQKLICSRGINDKTPLPPGCPASEGTGTVEIHGETLPEEQLASRQTSGYDTLMLMYRRNLLFQSYERAMMQTVKSIQNPVDSLEKRLSSYTNNMPQSQCEGSKYQTKKWWFSSWKTKFHTKTKDHWAVHYEVSGNDPGNAIVIRKEHVSNVLSLLSGKEPSLAAGDFTKSKYFLMDPLLFEGMKHGDYGPVKRLRSSSNFFGKKYRDLRKAWFLPGTGNQSYTKMHNDLKPKLREFYKNLKTNGEQRKFLYEPELVTTDAKDCLDNPEDPTKCADFEKFLETTLDETFAYFVAWSFSQQPSYKDYFDNAQTYRMRLLRKLKVDMENITNYYATIINQRDQQNECIERVVNGLADSGILDFTNDGLMEGAVGVPGPSRGSGFSGDAASFRVNSPRLSPTTRAKFSFDLRGVSPTSLSGGGFLDGMSRGSDGTQSTNGTRVSGTASFGASARGDLMRKLNTKALKAGVPLPEQERAFQQTLSRISAANKIPTPGASLGSFSASAPNLPVSVGATTSKSEENGSNYALDIKLRRRADSSAAVSATNGPTFSEPAGEEVSSPSTAVIDNTSLSEKEKKRVFSEYQRNKEKYVGDEADALFSKVSKAYVRNLDKVLKRKKKLED